MKLIGILLFLCFWSSVPAKAQSNSPVPASGGISSFFSEWDARALRSQLDQPNWLTPVVTSTSRLKQEIRYDIDWQRNADGTTAESYGGSKGFNTNPHDPNETPIN